jgi:hypothetical protein
MRREIRPRRITLGLKRPGERDGGGALAIGTDYLHGTQATLRVIQRLEKLLDPLQAERDPQPPVQLGADLFVGARVVQG